MTVPSSLSCRHTGKELGFTAGTWFINGYDSISGLCEERLPGRAKNVQITLDLYIAEGT